jgi:hypothetical protein
MGFWNALSTSAVSDVTEDLIVQDILSVGSSKPMGYLPLKCIHNYGYDVDRLASHLRQKGLHVVSYADGECKIDSGALVVYCPISLQAVLHKHKGILDKYHWPINTQDFARKVHCDETVDIDQQPELYRLIGKAFGDRRFVNVLGE